MDSYFDFFVQMKGTITKETLNESLELLFDVKNNVKLGDVNLS